MDYFLVITHTTIKKISRQVYSLPPRGAQLKLKHKQSLAMEAIDPQEMNALLLLKEFVEKLYLMNLINFEEIFCKI